MQSDLDDDINSNNKVDTAIEKIYLGMNGMDHLTRNESKRMAMTVEIAKISLNSLLFLM